MRGHGETAESGLEPCYVQATVAYGQCDKLHIFLGPLFGNHAYMTPCQVKLPLWVPVEHLLCAVLLCLLLPCRCSGKHCCLWQLEQHGIAVGYCGCEQI